MLSQKILRGIFFKKNSNNFSYTRTYSSNPFAKTWNILSNDVKTFLGVNEKKSTYPNHADIVIIGGGLIGSSVAYWLKTRAGEGLTVVVLDKDLTYKRAQSNLSVSNVTQHFSLIENVLLSQYSAEFLRNVKRHLGPEVNVQYIPQGRLTLASEKYAEKLKENIELQRECGVKNKLLSVEAIKENYPWINTSDVALGCLSVECEGIFNSFELLKGLIKKSIDLGAIYVNAEVSGFKMQPQQDVLMEGVKPGEFKRIYQVLYKTPDNEEHALKFACCILAAGDESTDIAQLAGIGSEHGLLNIPLPIGNRIHRSFIMEQHNLNIGSHLPTVMDTSGLWFRKNVFTNSLICGHEPLLSINENNLSSDKYLEDIIMPALWNRIPDSKNGKIRSLHEEEYDFNSYDETGIVGPHPYHNNLFIAAGFGKLGNLHAPGIGRAITELIVDSHYINLDLTRFSFDRLITDQPLIETNVY